MPGADGSVAPSTIAPTRPAARADWLRGNGVDGGDEVSLAVLCRLASKIRLSGGARVSFSCAKSRREPIARGRVGNLLQVFSITVLQSGAPKANCLCLLTSPAFALSALTLTIRCGLFGQPSSAPKSGCSNGCRSTHRLPTHGLRSPVCAKRCVCRRLRPCQAARTI